MAASKADIGRWFDKGKTDGMNWMVILTDTYDWEDFPAYFMTREVAKKKMADPGGMNKVMECYDLNADRDEQLAQTKCWAINMWEDD